MGLIVQKFGGTSTATAESREIIYEKVLAQAASNKTLVVVSAMGRLGAPYATDTLLNLLTEEYADVSKREKDMIFNCGEMIAGSLIAAGFQKRGAKAVFLTGAQAGIITEANHSDAKVIDVKPSKAERYLNLGYIVLVGGGQGRTEDFELTSLGRGGSDTTACALGTALNADRIEIYTDVKGIMTADPRVVKEAKILTEISHQDCINFALSGAKVMHPRSVEMGKTKPSIPLYVKSTFSDYVGTVIKSPENINSGKTYLVGVTSDKNGDNSQISLIGGNLLKADINTECKDILKADNINFTDESVTDEIISYNVKAEDEDKAVNALHRIVLDYIN